MHLTKQRVAPIVRPAAPTPAPTPVTPAPVASLALSPTTLALTVGQADGALVATPKDAAGNALSGRTTAYASSNTSVATVSVAGVVHQVAAGPATITATCEGQTASCAVTVAAAAPAPAPNPTPTTGTTPVLGFAGLAGNGTYVDVPALRTSPQATALCAFDADALRALLAKDGGGVGWIQMGEGGQMIGDGYVDPDRAAQTLTFKFFPRNASGSLIVAVPAAALPPSGGVVIARPELDYTALSGRLVVLRRDTQAQLAAPATCTLTATATGVPPWNGGSPAYGGRCSFGAVAGSLSGSGTSQNRPPTRLGLLWASLVAGVLTDAQACALPAVDTTGVRRDWDMRALPLGAGPGALSVPCVTPGGPALQCLGAWMYDPTTILPDDVPASIDVPEITTLTLGVSTGLSDTVRNVWGEPLAGYVPTMALDDPTLAHEVAA